MWSGMKKFVQYTLAIMVVAVSFFAITQDGVSAQSTGLRINPRADLTVRPGQTQSGQLLVSNLNREIPITVTLGIVDFKAIGETGSPSPILEDNAEPTPWSLKPFMTIPEKVDLEPGESKYVSYSVRIPEGQGAGSYYSAIQYEPLPSDDEDSVVVSGAPMQLVFVTVPGRATEIMNLERFGAYNLPEDELNGEFKSIFVGTQPVQLAYMLRNAGNVAENPTGSIVIKNIFGKQVHLIKEANPKGNLALIDQTRRFDVCIDSVTEEVEQDGRTVKVDKCVSPGFLPGMYRAEMSLFYGINGSTTQEINASTVFWYLPAWFIGVVFAVLAVLAFVIVKVRNSLIGRKSHSRRR